ncbi:MAG: ferritin-like protein [Chloroflexi bacterium]|nr:ferritin-like protein [Chloroflexota bacterium]
MIRTAEDLRDHLAVAMAVELSTIPPYLYAMYSVADPGAESARLFRSIVAEEMLHLALAANLLAAIGGRPDFLRADLQPAYPCTLAHHRPELPLHLVPMSVEAVRSTFMTIERPGAHGAPPEEDDYHSLGQFYAAIEAAFERLAAAGPLFAPRSEGHQLAGGPFYRPVEFDAEDSGGLVTITDLASAREAIEIIVHQGEGLGAHRWADPAHQELTHYAKLRRIADGTVPIGDVLPVRTDPRAADYPEDVRRLAVLANASYRALFHVLDDLYRPIEDKGFHVRALYDLMKHVLAPLARHLTTIDLGDGTVASPTFEPVDLGADPRRTLREMAIEVAAAEPALAETVSSLIDGSALGPVA